MRYSRVYVEITNICNRSCSFCHGTKREARRMTEGEFSHILSELEGLTEYIYLHVMGEPLTHPDLVRYIQLASSRGFKVAITTNGVLLPTRAEELLSSGVYKVNISLHSFEGDNEVDFIRYLEGCFDFADKASRAGILTVLRLWNRGSDFGRNTDILGLLRERFPLGEWREGARGYRIGHRLHLEWGERFGWPDADGECLGERVFCYGLSDHFGILSDGTVIPCCLDADGVISLGNAYTGSVREILGSKRARAIHEGFSRGSAVEQLCQRCPYARRFKI